MRNDFGSGGRGVKDKIRYPTVEGLIKAEKILNEIYNREPSEELLEIIENIEPEIGDKDSI